MPFLWIPGAVESMFGALEMGGVGRDVDEGGDFYTYRGRLDFINDSIR